MYTCTCTVNWWASTLCFTTSNLYWKQASTCTCIFGYSICEHFNPPQNVDVQCTSVHVYVHTCTCMSQTYSSHDMLHTCTCTLYTVHVHVQCTCTLYTVHLHVHVQCTDLCFCKQTAVQIN